MNSIKMGECIKRNREKKEISIEELAQKKGLDESLLLSYEAGAIYDGHITVKEFARNCKKLIRCIIRRSYCGKDRSFYRDSKRFTFTKSVRGIL